MTQPQNYREMLLILLRALDSGDMPASRKAAEQLAAMCAFAPVTPEDAHTINELMHVCNGSVEWYKGKP